MKKRSKAASKPAKARPRKPLKRKGRSAPNALSDLGAAPARETDVARLTRELNEAREQQTATGDVLKVISRSRFDLQAVLDTLVKLAARLCEAELVAIHYHRDGVIQFGARFGLSQEWEESTKRNPIVPGRGTVTGRVLLVGKTVQISDVKADPEYTFTEGQKAGGFRTVLGVPLEREGQIIGVIVLARTKVFPFRDRQIEFVQNFATQAVIAIENARLLNELKESLEQQTATSEVLQVISSSPGELERVFTAMLANATRICDAQFGNFMLREGSTFRAVAWHGDPTYVENLQREPLIIISDDTRAPLARLIETKEPVHVADLRSEPAYKASSFAPLVTLIDSGGARTLLLVPMLKEKTLVGAISIYRREVRPFSDRQIELVQNFANQAVIAIENTRLLNELRQRTSDLTQRSADLTESLEQQTATSEILGVISSSPTNVQPVLGAIVRTAVTLCESHDAVILLRDGDHLRIAAHYGPMTIDFERALIGRDWVSGRVVMDRVPVHVHDLTAEWGEFPLGREIALRLNQRTVLGLPLSREGQAIGCLFLRRTEVRPFSEKQIALLQTFADQAVIAIENARLFAAEQQRTNELTESLEQQTATSEVLQVISSSPGDLEPVFAAMLEKAVHICDAKFGYIYRWDGDAFDLVATYNVPPAFASARRGLRIHPEPGMPVERLLATKKTVHFADVAAEPIYTEERYPAVVAAVELGGVRTLLAVPMLKDSELIGVFAIYRQEVRPFTDKQIALVTNFSAQAVIAIENARLLNELRQRTEEVETLNQHLEQRVADQVGEIERMGRLRRFLPPQVADLIVASGTENQLESHRREITALFCDLRGFTGFSESSDPEDVMALLREYHVAIGEIIIRYSGTLERYAGDGVMVVFNDPIPVDNPALQAVQMALEMRDAIGALTEKWRQLGHEIGFGIGMAHGYATLGTIGFEGRHDYAAIGTVSNVASRLCDEAKPGQILISPRVLMAVKDAVTVEAVGEFELKGIRRPIAAYNVLAALPPSP